MFLFRFLLPTVVVFVLEMNGVRVLAPKLDILAEADVVLFGLFKKLLRYLK